MLRAYGDGNLFGEPYGEGSVQVVFLHGWARRGQDFAACAVALAEKGVASVALDLPGFGSSPLPTVAGGARHYADLLTPALRQMGAAPLVLVGHSLGGRVATIIAANDPDLVRALVLTGAPLIRLAPISKAPWRYRVTRSLHARGLVSEASMEAARQRYGSVDYRNSSGLLRDVLVAMVNENYEDEVRRQSVPVILLWGELDDVAPVAVATRTRELIQSPSSLRVVPGVGHLLPTQAPDELVTSILEALS